MPLYDLDERCTDPRYPRLVGPWVVGCDTKGRVAKALDLRRGRLVDLPRPLEHASAGDGGLYEPGRTGVLFQLLDTGVAELPELSRVTLRTVAPAATDGVHIAVLGADQLQAFDATDRSRRVVSTRPAGWYPPALAWPFVAWVAIGGDGDEDVLWQDTRARGHAGDPQPLAAGPGHQRHVVGQGTWLAWVEPEELVIMDTATGERRSWATRTGFSAPPSLWQGVACWEERDQGDIDIRCSDGMVAEGPGHQRWPSRWGSWLLYRQDGLVMLYTAPEGEASP